MVTKSLLMLALTMLHACASQQANRIPGNMLSASALPAGSTGLDHYIAWIPLEQAQTATVAEAMTHISLRNAREQVSHDLCNDALITDGNVIEKLGPVVAKMPASMGGHPAWYYRIGQQPGLRGCRTAQAASLYQALQARLPQWISINPARPVNNPSAGLRDGLLISNNR